MNKIQHDFVIVEPLESNGILKNMEGVNIGIIKEFGTFYWTDTGSRVEVSGIKIGDKAVFTQHIQLDIEGKKMYIARWRDIVMVKDV